MSHDESRHRHRERERGRTGPPVPPRSRSASYYTSYEVRPRRRSTTMDYDDPMVDMAPQHEVGGADVSGDARRQEAILLEFQAKMNQDMAGIQTGLNCLMQQVEAIPAQVAAGMSKPGGSGEHGWRAWLPGSTGYPDQRHEQPPAPPPHVNATRLAELQGENKVLGNRNSGLQRELEAAKRELGIAQRKAASVEAQLREHQEEVNKLRGKEAMFRTIILDQAGVQKISDDEILQGFLKLRQDVQKLSRSASYLVDTNPTISTAQEEATPSISSFYRAATWGQLGLVDRRLRVRAKIFDELHFHILGYNCFGLQGFQAEVGALTGPVEPGLRRFETILQDRGVSENVITDWRIATINCVELTGIEEMTSKFAATDIFAILAPLLSKHVRPSEEDVLRATILDLCKDAYKLRMMMRKSKDNLKERASL
ncbi:predicted protein [Chaetomium globosum CBS 148.51]|uniref:Uncharacterized protein n=1 Tax=Chaetomium globosum (strain ATCC 6205 / CBS 148.51 / DSM 1962 / NBRC 6347 / NRRL 1970) TaxID=306901 RepID=Q2GU22_CHAGB|nr:uncharacterized protein CHGG_08532 [Chaetomium globosum CBS 148.51]EAQ84518.1 predicted protein [Chaetomium globosum CBS 148.51]